jgi:phosphoglycerate dehydrogenase-like enzyme
MLSALGATVQVATPRPETVSGHKTGSVRDIVATSDIVSLHVPAGASTAGMIDSATLGAFKPGAVLINTSRGSVIDESALVAALRSGRLAAAVLDVRAVEPPVRDDLTELPNVVLSPHIAAFTQAAQRRVNETVTSDVLAVLSGGTPANVAS